jgi:hypothetical protein
MRASRRPAIVELVTWAVSRGTRMFQRVMVTDEAVLVATLPIPKYDFAVVVPAAATLSLLNLPQDWPHALRVSPSTVGTPLDWWPDATLDALSMTALLARASIAKTPGVASYLQSLPASTTLPGALESAAGAVGSKKYREAMRGVTASLQVDDATFDRAFLNAWIRYKQFALPMWTPARPDYGPRLFAKSSLASGGSSSGPLLAMVPVVDLAVHSPTPNCAVGMPDEDMKMWLCQERSLPFEDDYVVLQAERDIAPGEAITVSRNAQLQLDAATFAALFGFSVDSEELRT